MAKSHPKNLIEKSCSKCKEIKPVMDFYVSSKNPECFEAWCKVCKYSSRNKKVYFAKYWPTLTTDQAQGAYNTLFSRQNGQCAICEKHQSELNRALGVDHSHDTGHVRGLLCLECNLAIGKFHDSCEKLEKAIQYLNKSRLVLVKETMC